MSNINFPTSPYPGQIYTFNGNTWTWNGYTWTSQGISGPTGPTGATGSQGIQGPTGATGSNGISSNYYNYLTKTTINSGNPGSSYLIWNNPTQTSSTQINISHLTSDSVDIDIFLALLSTGDIIIIQDSNDSDNYQQWEISSSTTIIPNSYIEIPVIPYGVNTYSFPDGHPIIVATTTKGPTGPQGPQGIQGPTGPAGTTGPGSTTKTFGLVIDGGGSSITSGIKGDVVIPYNMTITGWTILSDQIGDIVIDLWKDTYANFPPTSLDTITGSEKPTLSSQTKNQDNSLSTWTTSVSSGDIIRFNVDSVSTVTRVVLTIQGNLI